MTGSEVALSVHVPEFDVQQLYSDARSRWLKPTEVLFILQNHDKFPITQLPPDKPPSGSLFLFNRRVLRFFRRDGHAWKQKKDGRTVGEAHERLKVGNVDALSCYYAHGKDNPYFQRRSYWMLDPGYDHIVLVHYREVVEGRCTMPKSLSLSLNSSLTINHSTSPCEHLDQQIHDLSSHSSISIGEIVCQTIVEKDDNYSQNDTGENHSRHPQPNFSQAQRLLESKLYADNDDCQLSSLVMSRNVHCEEWNPENNISGNRQNQQFHQQSSSDSKPLSFWEEMLLKLTSGSLPAVATQEEAMDQSLSDAQHSSPGAFQSSQHEVSMENLGHFSKNVQEPESTSLLAAEKFPLGFENSTDQPIATKEHQEIEEDMPYYTENVACDNTLLFSKENVVDWINGTQCNVNSASYFLENFETLFDQNDYMSTLGVGSSLTVAQTQLYSICDVSPEWAFSSENTKVIIVGHFLCKDLGNNWNVMFGDIEVPLEIIQDGVLRCIAPPHVAGRVSLCITSGNRESCSEVREFEYIEKPETSAADINMQNSSKIKSTEELFLLSRFVQILQGERDAIIVQKENNDVSEDGYQRKLKSTNSGWPSVTESLLSSDDRLAVMDMLFEELLKDKLEIWISSKSQKDTVAFCLLKKEQSIIHMVSGLGFEWALEPVLNIGVGIDFRDSNGWTALHWAAHFGREKMVAALLAAGASPGAVTDPTTQDPLGKNAASIAAASGHKGLAGYLSEVALTSHLSSLTLEEFEISKGSAELEAEKAVQSVNERNIKVHAHVSEEQLSLKQSLAAVRNAAQAAARIQAVFRAHSFRKRQQDEAALILEDDSMTSQEICEILAAAKHFQGHRGQNLYAAALCIQKKYRGWRGRKNFLALRQHILKIQAHVRGHQARKRYKEFLWMVNVLEKAILRWRRGGVGLRGFKVQPDIIDEVDDDILKVFRKQKVDAAIDEALSRVLCMAESPGARQQYRRMLECYHLAKLQAVQKNSSGVASSAESDCGSRTDNAEGTLHLSDRSDKTFSSC